MDVLDLLDFVEIFLSLLVVFDFVGKDLAVPTEAAEEVALFGLLSKESTEAAHNAQQTGHEEDSVRKEEAKKQEGTLGGGQRD